MFKKSAAGAGRLSRRERVRILLLLIASTAIGLVGLLLLLPTWEDAKVALAFGLGKSPHDINQEVAEAPLPPPPARPLRVERPPPPLPELPPELPSDRSFGGGPSPPPADSPSRKEYEMQKRQYEFYMNQLRMARQRQARQRTEKPAAPTGAQP